jgi:hypothetical protein
LSTEVCKYALETSWVGLEQEELLPEAFTSLLIMVIASILITVSILHFSGPVLLCTYRCEKRFVEVNDLRFEGVWA